MATKRRYCCLDNKSAVVGWSAVSVAIGMVSVTADKYEDTAGNLQPMSRWFADYLRRHFADRRVAVGYVGSRKVR